MVARPPCMPWAAAAGAVVAAASAMAAVAVAGPTPTLIGMGPGMAQLRLGPVGDHRLARGRTHQLNSTRARDPRPSRQTWRGEDPARRWPRTTTAQRVAPVTDIRDVAGGVMSPVPPKVAWARFGAPDLRWLAVDDARGADRGRRIDRGVAVAGVGKDGLWRFASRDATGGLSSVVDARPDVV